MKKTARNSQAHSLKSILARVALTSTHGIVVSGFVLSAALLTPNGAAHANDSDADVRSEDAQSTYSGSNQPAAVESNPEATNTKEPTSAESKNSDASGKDEASESPTEDYHARTPEILKDRLRVASGLSLGTGQGPTSDFSSDALGFSVSAIYTLRPFALAGLPLTWLATAKYASHSGVDTARSLNISVQRFLIGGGAELTREGSAFRPGVTLNAGLLKASSAAIQGSGNQSPNVRPALGIEPYVRYRVAPKIWAIAGADLSPLAGYTWYGLNLGASFSF